MTEDGNVHDATQDILRKIQADIAAFRGEVTSRFDKLEVEVSALTVGQRESRADTGEIKAGIEDIKETARLIEGRLVRLEKHAGFAKA